MTSVTESKDEMNSQNTFVKCDLFWCLGVKCPQAPTESEHMIFWVLPGCLRARSPMAKPQLAGERAARRILARGSEGLRV